MYMTDSEAKRWIIEIGRRMYARGFVAANDGNISVLTGPDRVWVTPAGVSKGLMTEDMLVCTDLDGNVLEGTWRPSSETKMHLRVYRENGDLRAAVHAHPVTATAFAVARIPMDRAIMIESLLTLGPVPVAEYAPSGTPAVADSIAPYCRTHRAVLLANHGALTWGTTPEEAWFRMEAVEHCAEVMEKLGLLRDATVWEIG